MIATDLVGEYVTIPSEGDAGWVRAVFNKFVSHESFKFSDPIVTQDSYLWVVVQRDNSLYDLKQYPVDQIVLKRKE